MKIASHLEPIQGNKDYIPKLPSTLWGFIGYALTRLKWWLVIILSLQIISTLCAVFIPYSLGKITNIITKFTPETLSPHQLKLPILFFILLNLGEVIFGRIAGFIRSRVAPLQRTWVTSELFAYLQHHSQRYLNQNFAGALASRISETAMGCNMLTWAIVFDFLPVILTMLLSAALLANVNVLLSAFTFVWGAFFLYASYLLARKCRTYSKVFSSARSETLGRVVDVITNLSIVKYFARTVFERKFLQKFLIKETNAAHRSFSYNEVLQLFQFVSALILKVGILLITIWLWGKDKLSVGDFVMSISLSFAIITEAKNISRRFLDLFEYIGNIENGVRAIVVPHEIVDKNNAKDIIIKNPEIEFKNVTFKYSNGVRVFDKLNMNIKAGEHIGLVGFSGSGKSTLTNLIMRMYDLESGKILIDGHDISCVTLESLRSHISFIPQDSSLFHRTIADNIRYGNLEATQQDVENAACKARAHDFIMRLPQGYNTIAGERGVNLSGGQRQRIAIARAFMQDAPIIIMDEATSSLDSIIESEIQQSVNKLIKGKTAIIIAHRLTTIANLDRIIYLEQGRILEQGKPQELLASNSHFKSLWDKQVGGVLLDQ